MTSTASSVYPTVIWSLPCIRMSTGVPVEGASVRTSLPGLQHLVRSPKWHRSVHWTTLEAHCMRRTWDSRYFHCSPIDLPNLNPLNDKEPAPSTHPSFKTHVSIIGVTQLSPFLAVRALYPLLWRSFLPPFRLACETWRKSLSIPFCRQHIPLCPSDTKLSRMGVILLT